MQQNSLQRILTGLAFFVATIIAAIAGYAAAGWSLLDAVYMVVITIFGVGYGEVRPINSPELKIFTMFVIIAGTTSAVYIIGGFVQLVTEGEINKALHSRRMTRTIESLEQHVIICGFGRIGQILARRLAIAHHPFVVIDLDHDRLSRAEAKGYLFVVGNAADESILQIAGIDQAKALATVLPDDAINVFITLTARELNPNLLILARGELPSTEKKLRLAGANQVVLPAAIGAERMAHMITHPSVLDFLQQAEGRSNLSELLAEIEIQLDELVISSTSPFAHKPISSMEIRGKGTFIIVAVQQANGTTVTSPPHELILQPGDIVIVIGRRGDMPNFVRRYAITYRGARL